jgi:hypothetical protein
MGWHASDRGVPGAENRGGGRPRELRHLLPSRWVTEPGIVTDKRPFGETYWDAPDSRLGVRLRKPIATKYTDWRLRFARCRGIMRGQSNPTGVARHTSKTTAMDAKHFDSLNRSWLAAGFRRGALRLLGAPALGRDLPLLSGLTLTTLLAPEVRAQKCSPDGTRCGRATDRSAARGGVSGNEETGRRSAERLLTGAFARSRATCARPAAMTAAPWAPPPVRAT